MHQSSSDPGEVLECMPSKNVNSIISSVPADSANPVSTKSGLTISNLTVFSDYPACSTAGNFIKVPLLIGNADYEAGLFATLATLASTTLPKAAWDIFDVRVFTCPARVRANSSVRNDIPTWRTAGLVVFQTQDLPAAWIVAPGTGATCWQFFILYRPALGSLLIWMPKWQLGIISEVHRRHLRRTHGKD